MYVKNNVRQWWNTPLVLEAGRSLEFKPSLVYTAGSQTACTTQRNAVFGKGEAGHGGGPCF